MQVLSNKFYDYIVPSDRPVQYHLFGAGYF